MEILCKHLHKIRVPCDDQLIYKEKCMFSYDNPECPTGLYVNLTSFLSFGEDYVQEYAEKTGNCVFLHICREKLHKESPRKSNDEAGPERKVPRSAIEVEAEYNDNDSKNYEYKNNYSIVVMPDLSNKLPFPNNDLPLIVTQAVESILGQDCTKAKLEKHMITSTWDVKKRQESKFSESLQQINNGKQIPSSGWKCEKCDLTNNLWLNLTDGSILCGRKFFDGSGGNNHAAEHYREFGHPLAVKLGTIAADGQPDVFSYPEDELVIDSKLEDHLTHFGINKRTMNKSEQSIVDLELDIADLLLFDYYE